MYRSEHQSWQDEMREVAARQKAQRERDEARRERRWQRHRKWLAFKAKVKEAFRFV